MEPIRIRSEDIEVIEAGSSSVPPRHEPAATDTFGVLDRRTRWTMRVLVVVVGAAALAVGVVAAVAALIIAIVVGALALAFRLGAKVAGR